MYAIIKQGGKQYKVQEGDYLTLDKINAQPKDTIEVTDVLAIGGDELTIGDPFVKNAKVELEIVHSGRGKKVIIFKKRRRKDSKLKRGFRRSYTQVKVSKIVA